MQRMVPRRERRLEQIGRIHRAARRRAGADHGVDLVDEHDRARIGLDLLDHLLEPLLEVAAVARAGQQRAHVEREHGRALEHVRHFAMHDAARETFRDRGLADAGVADEQRIVLLPPAEHLDRAVDLGVAPDQRIDLAVLGLLVEIDAIGVERVALLLGLVAALGVGLLLDAAHRTRLREARPLGDAVADVIDRVVARHVLLLQEISGVALAFGEDRDQHVGAGDLFAPRRLHVDDRALDHALEAGGRLGILGAVGDQVFEFGFQIGREAALAACRDRHCRRASPPRRPDRRSAPAAGVRAWRIRGAAHWRAPARDAKTAQDCAKRLALDSHLALYWTLPGAYFFSITHCKGC